MCVCVCVTAAALPEHVVPSGVVMLHVCDLSHFQKQNTWWVWNWITWISKKTNTESGSVRSVGVSSACHGQSDSVSPLRTISCLKYDLNLFEVWYCIFNVQLTETSLWIMTLYFKSKGGTNFTLLYIHSISCGGGGWWECRLHRTAAPVSFPTNSQWSGSCFWAEAKTNLEGQPDPKSRLKKDIFATFHLKCYLFIHIVLEILAVCVSSHINIFITTSVTPATELRHFYRQYFQNFQLTSKLILEICSLCPWWWQMSWGESSDHMNIIIFIW